MAFRLAQVIDKLIGPTQTTFIRVRNIIYNIVSAQETFYQVRKIREKRYYLR
jgi:hypothetical protein